MVVDLAHGDGGDQACWAVLVMTEPATAATAPPRTVAQTAIPSGAGLFTSPLWCGDPSGARVPPGFGGQHRVGRGHLGTHQRDAVPPVHLAPRRRSRRRRRAGATATTPPTPTTIRRRLDARAIKSGPWWGMPILVMAAVGVTDPHVTRPNTARGEAAAAALPVAERPTTTIRSDGSSSSAAASCGTRWTYTYSPGWAPHLPSGNLTIRVGDCFDRAPFGAGAAADSDVSPNACPTETSWIGADTRHVVIDNTPPAPVTVTLTREDDGNACPAGGVGGGEVVWITVDFDETTSRPTFTCLGNAVPSPVTIPGARRPTPRRFGRMASAVRRASE